MQELTIDYSKIQEKPVESKSTWRPPRHVFFGKKDPETGVMDEEPQYVYQEFPRMLYLKLDNRIEATVVETQEDLDEKLAGGWVKNPALLGFLTAPSFEQLKEMSKPKVEKAETKTLTLNKK